MAIIPSFTAIQSSSVLSTLTVTDTSTGTDILITQRRVYLIQANGDFLVNSDAVNEQYFAWDYADTSIDITDILDVDYAIYVRVDWLNVSDTVLYTETVLNGYPGYEENFLYGLTGAQTSNPSLINNANYYLSKMTLRVQVDDATQAITQGGDIFSAQAAYNRGMYLVNNPQTFF